MRGFVAAAVLAASLLPGCSFLKPVDVEARTALIDQLPPRVAQGKPHAATLVVAAPEAAAPYDTPRIAYSTAPHEVAYYARIEWVRPPARMIHPLLVQAMRATQAFGAVEAPPYLERYRYTLRTGIRELRMDFTAGGVLRLAVHARLADEDSGRALLDQDFVVEEPIAARTPEAGVAAANAATAKMLGELAEAVVRALG